MSSKIKPIKFNASGIIGANGGSVPTPVTLRNLLLTETGGTTNETLALYVPAAAGDNSHPALPSSSGTQIGEIIVPKGTTLWLHELNWYFENGLYIAASGGTLVGTIGIS